jgi:hypothetical protein
MEKWHDVYFCANKVDYNTWLYSILVNSSLTSKYDTREEGTDNDKFAYYSMELITALKYFKVNTSEYFHSLWSKGKSVAI